MSPTCAMQQSRDSSGNMVFDATCDIGGRKTKTHGVISGDFQSHYTLDIVTDSEGGNPALPKHSEMTQEATWIGACPAGMKPGDMVMPGGRTINLLEHDEAAADEAAALPDVISLRLAVSFDPAFFTTPAFLMTLAAAVVAALVRGFAGFGAALIFVPVASAAYGPTVAAPTLLLVDFVLTFPFFLGAVRPLPLADGPAHGDRRHGPLAARRLGACRRRRHGAALGDLGRHPAARRADRLGLALPLRTDACRSPPASAPSPGSSAASPRSAGRR